jgi:hypothetical protein
MKYLKRNVPVTSFCLLICSSLCPILYAWENVRTHPGITQEAINTSAVDNYLKKQMGLNDGVSFNLHWNFPADVKNRIKRGSGDEETTTRTILEWIKTGSVIEDEDGRYWPIRSRHHFYDPFRNSGLDNQSDHPNWKDFAKIVGLQSIDHCLMEEIGRTVAVTRLVSVAQDVKR